MKLYIYNQWCITAGESVPERELERRKNPDKGRDWTVYEGTEDELLKLARNKIKIAAMCVCVGDKRYWRRVARTILERLSWDDEKIDEEIWGTPDLTPEQTALLREKILAAARDTEIGW